MDKTPFESDESSSVEPNKLDTDHSGDVEANNIDTSLLANEGVSPVLDKKNPSHDELSLDEDWLRLSQDWQEQPFEKTDIKKLLKQTKKRTLQAKFLLSLNVLATIAIVIMLIVAVYQGDWGTASIIYLSFGSVASIIFVYYEIKIRLHTWQQSSDSPDKAIANAIAGVESSIKYIRLTKLSFWLFLPLVNWYIYATITESEKSPWPPFFVINIFLLVMWLITHWFQRKRVKELSELLSI
ncbi:hypothetical protein Q4530_14315 [Colwellia sp. 1_MG-2023]|uniref:hypothetical protein n=1 Tax=unclassified Colwellia TaxID=196834 RepID=UPI001C08E805|nr:MULTISPECIES: hypothetical protein [unclassified Colwellia]MBU2925553.1 hypothetical protein [Colwellia sp. C2M11]MDO6651478.1 hypothetical protein [Colwellia sp. 3_MG-2023]MDO6666833.1 hypothetical protein [Colwellia sp. 2_MG-2023]MDO6690947.1 hypothetical protein [Colwellia sp. 1_MG-2023]